MKMHKLFVILFSITLWSCQKASNVPVQLIGTWKMTASNDNYKSENGFTQYDITDSDFINATFTSNGYITLSKKSELLYKGKYTVNHTTETITILEEKNSVLYNFTIMHYDGTTLKVGYKTTDGLYIHWFVRK